MCGTQIILCGTWGIVKTRPLSSQARKSNQYLTGQILTSSEEKYKMWVELTSSYNIYKLDVEGNEKNGSSMQAILYNSCVCCLSC